MYRWYKDAVLERKRKIFIHVGIAGMSINQCSHQGILGSCQLSSKCVHSVMLDLMSSCLDSSMAYLFDARLNALEHGAHFDVGGSQEIFLGTDSRLHSPSARSLTYSDILRQHCISLQAALTGAERHAGQQAWLSSRVCADCWILYLIWTHAGTPSALNSYSPTFMNTPFSFFFLLLLQKPYHVYATHHVNNHQYIDETIER